MAFQGSLRELPLPDVIQLVAVSGKTGVFTLKNGPESGRIFLRTYIDLSTPLRKDQAGELIFGYAMPEGWERLQKIFLSGEKPVLAKPVDLAPVVTGDLVADVNRFDREKVRQQARTYKP